MAVITRYLYFVLVNNGLAWTTSYKSAIACTVSPLLSTCSKRVIACSNAAAPLPTGLAPTAISGNTNAAALRNAAIGNPTCLFNVSSTRLFPITFSTFAAGRLLINRAQLPLHCCQVNANEALIIADSITAARVNRMITARNTRHLRLCSYCLCNQSVGSLWAALAIFHVFH